MGKRVCCKYNISKHFMLSRKQKPYFPLKRFFSEQGLADFFGVQVPKFFVCPCMKVLYLAILGAELGAQVVKQAHRWVWKSHLLGACLALDFLHTVQAIRQYHFT